VTPARPHRPAHLGAFGNDRFGVLAERFARFFGTPRFIIGQTILVAIWIALNGLAVGLRWDPYPFILLNLAFSTQAAYAAPLILLAQTRQADRDKKHADMLEEHRNAQTKHEQAAERRETEYLEQERDLHGRVLKAVDAEHAADREGGAAHHGAARDDLPLSGGPRRTGDPPLVLPTASTSREDAELIRHRLALASRP
jgi:uncharacterized membrane protein